MTTSGDPIDPTERLLSDALQRLDPGPAPDRLRRSAHHVPDTVSTGRGAGLGARQTLEAGLGLAASVLLAIIGYTILGGLGSPLAVAGPAATPQLPAAPSAGVIPFDQLTLVGPGMLAPSAGDGPGLAVGSAVVVLVLLAVTIRGWRRLVPAGLAVLLTVYAIVATQAPVTLGIYFSGPGLNIREATSAPGSSELLYYETAPARGLFVIGTGWLAESPLPVRLDGFVDPQVGWHDQFAGVQWLAAWIDGEPHGGTSGPVRAFEPFELSRDGQGLWFVGRAGACALGSAFDPAHPDNVGVWTSPDMFDAVVSVLGWPRTIHLDAPFHLVEPNPATWCIPDSPTPSFAVSSPAPTQ